MYIYIYIYIHTHYEKNSISKLTVIMKIFLSIFGAKLKTKYNKEIRLGIQLLQQY